MQPFSAANTRFFLNLFKEISKRYPSGNLFYSPVSISSALAMVLLGARGNTADQMNKVLGFKRYGKPHNISPGHHVDKINSSYKFMSELNKPGEEDELSLYDRLYGEQSYEFVEEFLDDANIYYEDGLEKVDFKTESEAARFNLNKLREKKTHEKIKYLLSLMAANKSASKAIMNAIFLNGTWNPRDWQFNLNMNKTEPVTMMHQIGQFPLAFIPEINSHILELPYVGENHSMLIILPNKIEDTTGLLEHEQTLKNLIRTSNMSEQEVQVSLPRLTMEDAKKDSNERPTSMEMVDVFGRQNVNLSGMSPNKGFVEFNEDGPRVSKANINITKTDLMPSEPSDMNESQISKGMEDVFDQQKANLSGMSPNNDLVLSKVIHKPFVEFTEAAAATGAIRNLNRMVSRPVSFNADHPFLFFIRHNPSRAHLLYGRICSP